MNEENNMDKQPENGRVGQSGAVPGSTAFRKEVVGNCTLYLADCRDIFPLLEGVNVDAVVSDPPYGIDFDCSKKRQRNSGLSWGKNRVAETDRAWKKIKGDDKPFDPLPWIKFKKVVLWGGNHYADKLPPSSCWLVWDKKVDTTPDNFSDCELAWTNLPGVVRNFSHLWRGIVRAGKENVSNGPKLHPFQKPEALMSWCLMLCKLNPGAIVLDPYMGSGTTGVACVKRGLQFIGVEDDKDHFETALKRLRNEQKQGRLF